ncbi:MAG: glycosyltransferase family 4 protein [Elusimicrobia bacterium]|nr:glycosyltransferase family 4 protein [Elusimicrobiota bacterium]
MIVLNVTEAPGWSGGTNQMLLTSRELTRRGHKMILACPEGSVLAERATKHSLPVRSLNIREDYDLPAAWKLARMAREEGASIVHAHHPRAHAVALIARLLGSRSKLLVTRRVIFPIRTNPFSALKYRAPLIDRFIAVCHAAADELAKAGVPRSRISVIPSAVEISRWEEARKARASLPPQGPFRIGLIGHYAVFKGHEVLLEAAKEILAAFPDARFVLAGRGTEELRGKAESLGIAAQVDILGPRDDVPDIVSKLHIFAMPSLQEGIATALMEAQVAGVPCVASRVGGIPDVLVDGETGLLVEPRNPKALADAILRLLRNPSEAQALAKRGCERVKSLFALPAVADRLEALYKEVG